MCGIAGIVSMLGPGAIASVALVAPLAMAIGARTGVPAFLTALMVANGANAGNLSPLSAIGVIANTRMAAAGLGGQQLSSCLVAGVVRAPEVGRVGAERRLEHGRVRLAGVHLRRGPHEDLLDQVGAGDVDEAAEEGEAEGEDVAVAVVMSSVVGRGVGFRAPDLAAAIVGAAPGAPDAAASPYSTDRTWLIG